jgi:hypothetical protein
MPHPNLASATAQLVETSGNTARNMITACRVGNARVVGFMDQRWESALDRSGKKLSTEVRGNALRAQRTLSALYTQGYTLATDGADALVGKAIALAGMGIHQAAANASQFQKKTGVKTLQSLAQVAVPAVAAVTQWATTLEKQSGRLANTLAGKDAAVKVAAVKRVTPFRKARARKAS